MNIQVLTGSSLSGQPDNVGESNLNAHLKDEPNMRFRAEQVGQSFETVPRDALVTEMQSLLDVSPRDQIVRPSTANPTITVNGVSL